MRPTGRERTFGADELIVFKTNTRGVTTYADDVFCRVGAYELHEVAGQPHDLTRHPETPRAVFELLRDTVCAGRELLAHVDDLAADGASHWVLAHVTPSAGPGGKVVGHHSNRRRPARAGVAAVQPLYRELLAEESRHGTGRAVAEAGGALLAGRLAERGVDCDEVVWSLVPDVEA
ncbi:PAS domain-containing protein [Kineococcus arenarius]|uniref:PAS domain-containing protein n=1 Tax=unclassified Kineococcus TaxID=2621656 RepID=UPI003D7CF3C6